MKVAARLEFYFFGLEWMISVEEECLERVCTFEECRVLCMSEECFMVDFLICCLDAVGALCLKSVVWSMFHYFDSR